MPPCAQTERGRLTGTRENKSVGMLPSHSLMTLISPASPPPTTMTRRTAPDDVRTTFFVATEFILCDEVEEESQRSGSTTEHRSSAGEAPARSRPGNREPVAKKIAV